MPISLHKVSKKIKSKKGGKLDSLGRRDSKKLNRATLRDERLKKSSASRSRLKEVECMLPQIQLLEFVNLQHAHKNTNDIVVRVGYFKVETKDTTIPLSTQQIRNLIEKWVRRDDTELFRIKSERRPGRPPSTSETFLEQRINCELEEFRTGFYVPELRDWENLGWLRRWDGTVGSLAQIKFVRISKTDSPMEMEPGENAGD